MPTKQTTEPSAGHGGAGRGQGRKPQLRQSVTETCSFVLTASEKAKLKQQVKASGLSQSSFVRRALGFPVIPKSDKESE